MANFDLEKKPAIMILVLIVGLYAGISFFMIEPESVECLYYGYHDTGIQTGLCGDYVKRLQQLEVHDFTQIQDFRHWFSYSVIKYSEEIHPQLSWIISFVSSISILFLVYFISRTVTKTNYAGLIATSLVLISPLFYKYDTSITYPSLWVSIWLASILLCLKGNFASSAVYGVSVLAKSFNAFMFPVNLLFLKGKKQFVGYFVLIGITVFIFAYFFEFRTGNFHLQVNFIDFLYWLGMWAIEFTNDRVSLYLIFLSIPGLFLLHKAKVPYAKIFLVGILIMMFQPAVISGFTTFTNEEYRFLPMVAFVAVGISLIVANLDKLIVEVQRFQTVFQK